MSRNDLIDRNDAVDGLRAITPYRQLVKGEYVLLLPQKSCFRAIKKMPSTDEVAGTPQGEWADGKQQEFSL